MGKITIIEDDVYGRLVDGSTDDAPSSIDIMDAVRSVCSYTVKTKPTYADTWMVGDASTGVVIDSYDTEHGSVSVCRLPDGSLEYRAFPMEYGLDEVDDGHVSDTIDSVRTHFISSDDVLDEWSVRSFARDRLMGRGVRMDAIDGMCDTICRHTVGLGIFDVLLGDERIEDIYVDAPCGSNPVYVTLSDTGDGNGHVRCGTNLIADEREVSNLISYLKRTSGLPFTHTSPVMEADMAEYDTRATVIGYPMSPRGNAVALRRHSSTPWTLPRLVGNGTMSETVAGLLSFLVDMRCSILVCGARGSGKSSLLSALMFEFPVTQRILTIEDTMELPCDLMRKRGFKVQSMLADDSPGNHMRGTEEALRASLRMGESAIVIGEVRGDEAKILYQSMRTGKAGSSVMGTVHGDSAESVRRRMVNDIGISEDSFLATDVIITMGTVRRDSGMNAREVTEAVAVDADGFIPLTDADGLTDALCGTPVMERIMRTASMTSMDIINEIGSRSRLMGMRASGNAVQGNLIYPSGRRK